MEHSIFDQITPQDRAEFAARDQQLDRLYQGGALDDWLAFCTACDRVREITMHRAKANSTRDHAYKAKLPHILRQLMPHFLNADGYVRDEFANLLYLHEPENQMRLAEYRATLTPAKLAALATPKAARNAVRAMIKAEDAAKEAARLRLAADENIGADDAPPPTKTDEEIFALMAAAIKYRSASQFVAAFVTANFDLAVDIAALMSSEVKERRRDMRIATRRAIEADPTWLPAPKRTVRRPLTRGM